MTSNPSVLGIAWQRYLYQLNKRPLRTKALTAAGIAALSDIIAQRVLTGGYRSGRRTVAVALYGLIYTGPAAHYWQKFVQWAFCTCGKGSNCNCSSDALTVFKKVLVDQVTYGPVCNVMFLCFTGMILEARPWSDVGTKVFRNYPAVQLNAWRLWPLASLINFKFVPIKLRVLFINLVALVWSTFLLMRARVQRPS